MKIHQIGAQWSVQRITLMSHNIIEPTMETLSTEEQQEFEEHKEQLINEDQAKFLANFKVDRNHKVV
jgi:hypothetical protein